MELRRTPFRRAGLAALAALLVIGASACSGGTALVGKAPAATVDDAEISQADVVAATEATQRFYEYSIEQGQDTDGSLTALLEDLQGQSSYAVGTAGASKVLSDMIEVEVKRQELARQDALPTEADRDKIRTDLESTVGGAAALEEFPAEYVELYLEQRAVNEAFQTWAAAEADKDVEPLTDEEREAKMRELYEQTAPGRPLCLNAIQTPTEEEAEAARARVDGGEDFLAVSESLVPEGTEFPEEGLVACLGFDEAQTAFGEDFSNVAVGDIVGPVPFTSQEGAEPVYLVFRVDGLEGQTYEELLPQLEQAVPAEPEATDPTTFDASAQIDALIKEADIDVNAIFGRWSNAQRAVVPPKVPGAPLTTTVPTLTGS
ncbi:hypothetical protein ACE2AJ_05845 [Aquihabitans daechungensis]|uniref:hypothetical protein n=1 Tax=Aquihabitans daechungensis TaxID=1052257 RepID=UPI003BA3B22B